MNTYINTPRRDYTPEQITSLPAPELLKDLSGMPIFRLSLSSKELFHSNFLEFLWMSDQSAFIQMIRNLLGDDEALPELPNGNVYFLDREKENFDICIYHLVDDLKPRGRKRVFLDPNEKPKRVVYDLIIENKVKSIPYREQLLKYVERVEQKRRKDDNCVPRYLLLSLAESFPDKNNDGSVMVHYKVKKGKKLKEGDATWKTVNYLTLRDEIRKGWKDPEGSSYIADYCDFIYRLHYLQRAILSTILEQNVDEPLFKDYNKYKECRLHDLYVKLRCTKFMMHLKDNLGSVRVKLLPANEVRKQTEPGVYLNVNVFNGVGQVGALVWDGGKTGMCDLYEVIVQGEQFRHGIGQNPSSSKEKDWDRLNEMWDRLNKDPDSLSYSYLHNILDKTDPDIIPESANKKEKVDRPYDAYDSGYIYRYIPCGDWNALTLLENMSKDVEEIAKKLNVIL
jgi:hypothetical protein